MRPSAPAMKPCTTTLFGSAKPAQKEQLVYRTGQKQLAQMGGSFFLLFGGFEGASQGKPPIWGFHSIHKLKLWLLFRRELNVDTCRHVTQACNSAACTHQHGGPNDRMKPNDVLARENADSQHRDTKGHPSISTANLTLFQGFHGLVALDH